MKSRGSQCNETLLVRAAVRRGKKLGLQSAAKNLQWRRCPYWLRQTVPNRCSSRREGSSPIQPLGASVSLTTLEVIQPIRPQNYRHSLTEKKDRRTDGRIDRQHAVAISRAKNSRNITKPVDWHRFFSYSNEWLTFWNSLDIRTITFKKYAYKRKLECLTVTILGSMGLFIGNWCCFNWLRT